MKLSGRKLLVCNCERTMEIDAKALARALGAKKAPAVHTQLCRGDVESFAKALDDGEPVLVACTQEAPLFRELAEDSGREAGLAFANIRERAGWCEAKSDVAPKMAALLAEAALDVTPAGSISLKSDGICLVYGSGQAALDAARELAGRLSVSLLLKDADDALPPAISEVPVHSGEITQVSGHLGQFEITVSNYAPMMPSSKGSLQFLMARESASSTCSLILDMSGGTPLISSHDKRDGYFHVDAAQPGAVARAMFEISDLVGEFEKPIYVRYRPDICAHSRSGKIGCTRCLDACPASAIAPDGDLVRIDPALCGGCGNCNSVCPTGAASYDYPGREGLSERLFTLAATYLGAGGKRPLLLVHDERRGAETVGALARFGRGLPANVIPFSLNEVTLAGHDFMAAALAAGFEQVVLLAHPGRASELAQLEEQVALANAFMRAMGYGDDDRVRLVVEQDPEALEGLLYELPGLAPLTPASFAPVADKRELSRLALGHLNESAAEPSEIIALPEGAPYGRITVDTDGCTLCLACVSACPVNALQDDPERPLVKFVEQACVQCGLCRNTCPESVIALEPRYNFTSQAMTPVVLHEEEPYACIRCGKPFGTKSSVERVLERLGGKHWMFKDEETAKLIQMCDDCRVVAQAEGGRDPMAFGEPPRIRTTEDYLSAEAALHNGGDAGERRKAEDFLKDD